MSRSFVVLIAAILGCQAPAPAARDSAHAPAAAPVAPAPDSVVRADAVFHGRSSVTPGLPPKLVAEVHVRSRSAQPELVIESDRGNCNPPLYLRPTGGGREVTWSDIAWQARTVYQGARGVNCMGTGLGVVLQPGQTSLFIQRAYAVPDVRGDSLAAGWYDVTVAVVLYDNAPDGRLLIDTLRVPAGRVRLP